MSDIKLTLDGLDEAPQAPELQVEPIVEAKQEIVLSPEEQKVVDDFANKIDLGNSNVVLQYGAAAQAKISGFSEKTLESVRTKDLGEVGKLLGNVVTELKSFNDEDDNKFLGIFKKSGNKIAQLKAKYAKAETNINDIIKTLENHQITLMKDVANLDQMYQLNQDYYKELTMYIMAGNKKLEDTRNNLLPKLKQDAQASGLPADAQKANDLANLCNRFEKKLHDLDLTRTVSLQMAPQIRMVQASDAVMVEKIQSTLVNTIPLWKSQMVLALGVEHSTRAARAQQEVSDFTNQLLRKNADTLKMSTIETAKAAERGIIDVETLKHTNEQLISALDEVRTIQEQGSEKRRLAEQELRQIETQLKNRLLQR